MELNRHELLELIGMVSVRIEEYTKDMRNLITDSAMGIVAKRIGEHNQMLNKLKEQLKNR